MVIGRGMDHLMSTKKGGYLSHSHKWDKKMKHCTERRRAKIDPECFPEYKIFWLGILNKIEDSEQVRSLRWSEKPENRDRYPKSPPVSP